MYVSLPTNLKFIYENTWYSLLFSFFLLFFFSISFFYFFYFISLLLILFFSLLIKEYRWVGEKYDGIRLCWNPITLKAYPSLSFSRLFYLLFFFFFTSFFSFLSLSLSLSFSLSLSLFFYISKDTVGLATTSCYPLKSLLPFPVS